MKRLNYVHARFALALLAALGGTQIQAKPRALAISEYGASAYVVWEPTRIPIPPGSVSSIKFSSSGAQALILQVENKQSLPDVADHHGASSTVVVEALYLWQRRDNSVKVLGKLPQSSGFKFSECDFLPDERLVLISKRTLSRSQVVEFRILGNGLDERVSVGEGGNREGVRKVVNKRTSSVLFFSSTATVSRKNFASPFLFFDAQNQRWSPLTLPIPPGHVSQVNSYSLAVDSFLITTRTSDNQIGHYFRLSGDGKEFGAVAREYQVEARKADASREAESRSPRLFSVYSAYQDRYLVAGKRVSQLSLGPVQPEREGGPHSTYPLYFAPGATTTVISPLYDGVAGILTDGVEYFPVSSMATKDAQNLPFIYDKKLALERAELVGSAFRKVTNQPGNPVPDGAFAGQHLSGVVENIEALSGLIYTLRRFDKLSDMESVSDTQIGFLRATGGRALIFADGSVRWEDNPKPTARESEN